MKTDGCIDCPASLLCASGAMSLVHVYVCSVCEKIMYVTDRHKFKRCWFEMTADSHNGPTKFPPEAAVELTDFDCPRIQFKVNDRGVDIYSDGVPIKSTYYMCPTCYKKSIASVVHPGGTPVCNPSYAGATTVYYYLHGRRLEDTR